jgi:hypothetical protein
MLKLKHASQVGNLEIDASGSMRPVPAVKQSKFSSSDVSWGRRLSIGSISSSVSGGKNEYPGNVYLAPRCSNISKFINDESDGSLLPFLPTRSHDIDDYYQAIRGNTQNVLSLYSSLSQDNTSSSISLARMFQTLKEGFEQKQVEQHQQGNESNASVHTGCIPPIKASSSMSLRSSLKPSRFRGSHVGRQRRATCGVRITRGGKNEFFEVDRPPHPPFFLDEKYEMNNVRDDIFTHRPPIKVTIVTSAQIVTHAQANKEPTTQKSSQDEQDTDFDSSDDDDTSNNGNFEYYPRRSRHKALERSIRSSATSLNSTASSLLVEWSDAGELNNGCYEHPYHSRQMAVEKSIISSVTSLSSVGSSLLVEWDDAGDSSDDSD